MRARALRFWASPAAAHARASVTAASGEVSGPARSAAASAAWMSPAAAYARDSARLSLWSSQAGTDHPDRALAKICAAAAARPRGQAAVRRGQLGHRPDQLVRGYAQGRRPPAGAGCAPRAARDVLGAPRPVRQGPRGRGPGRAAAARRLAGPRPPGRPAAAARDSRPRNASPAPDAPGSRLVRPARPKRSRRPPPTPGYGPPGRDDLTTARQLRGRTAPGPGCAGAGRACRPGPC